MATLSTVSFPTLMGCSGCPKRSGVFLDVSSTANPFLLSSWRMSAQLSQLCVPNKTPMAGVLSGHFDPVRLERPPTSSLAITDPPKRPVNHLLFATGDTGGARAPEAAAHRSTSCFTALTSTLTQELYESSVSRLFSHTGGSGSSDIDIEWADDDEAWGCAASSCWWYAPRTSLTPRA